MTPQIIGFSGKKQGGKSTAAKCLVEKYPDARVWSLAAPLKRIVTECFVPDGWVLDLDDEEDKMLKLPCGKTVREVLQIVGTDMFRQVWSECWVNAFRQAVGITTHPRIIVPDVRFPNELRAIQELGGHVVRLTRAPLKDTHESETALDDAERRTRGYLPRCWAAKWAMLPETRGLGGDVFDALLCNDDMTIPQQNDALWNLMSYTGWLK